MAAFIQCVLCLIRDGLIDATGMLQWRRYVRVAPLRLCSYLLLDIFLLSLYTRITSALIVYDKRTLLDIGRRYTNLLQDTLSTNPAWSLEILQNTEVNEGHLNNPRGDRSRNTAGNML